MRRAISNHIQDLRHPLGFSYTEPCAYYASTRVGVMAAHVPYDMTVDAVQSPLLRPLRGSVTLASTLICRPRPKHTSRRAWTAHQAQKEGPRPVSVGRTGAALTGVHQQGPHGELALQRNPTRRRYFVPHRIVSYRIVLYSTVHTAPPSAIGVSTCSLAGTPVLLRSCFLWDIYCAVALLVEICVSEVGGLSL